MTLIKKLFTRYRGIITYLFFGGCSTAVNIAVYYCCAHLIMMSTAASTVAAWITALVFAFVTNKLWVFESKSWDKNIVLKEAVRFTYCRLATGVMDLLIMLVFVDYLHFNDVVIKVVSNILVIIANYAASRLLVFKNNGAVGKSNVRQPFEK